jgi:GSCFA family
MELPGSIREMILANLSNFNKQLLSEGEILESFNSLYAEAKKFNPSLKFILTLSPVRHVKDTLELNSVSKAILRSACHSIVTTHSDIDYFPAFEIMTDDLRDYRFYKSDMLHPTEEAEDYIWEKFMNTFFDRLTIELVNEWANLRAALEHKPFHPQSRTHQKFLKLTLAKLVELKSKINVDQEIAAVQSQIINP